MISWKSNCHIRELLIKCYGHLNVMLKIKRYCQTYNACGRKCCCLSHWGRVRHICISKLTIIGSNNGLSPDQRQAIIWTNAGILLIWILGTNFNENVIEIHTFAFKEMHLKMLLGKWRPFCLGLNVLTHWGWVTHICVSKLTITGSDNGLSPSRRQAIIWTYAGILLIGTLGSWEQTSVKS